MVDTVWSENIDFQTDRFLFDKTNLKFVWHLQQSHAVHELMDIMNNNNNNCNNNISDNNNNNNNPSLMSQFCLFCLRFDVEVLAAAKACALVHMFFERLEVQQQLQLLLLFIIRRWCWRTALVFVQKVSSWSLGETTTITTTIVIMIANWNLTLLTTTTAGGLVPYNHLQ